MSHRAPSDDTRATLMSFVNWFLRSMALVYAAWFWWKGIFSLPPYPCTPMGFFFAKVRLRGWLRILHLIWYTCWLVKEGLQGLVGFVACLYLLGAVLLASKKIPAEIWKPKLGRKEWFAWVLDPEPEKYEGYRMMKELYAESKRKTNIQETAKEKVSKHDDDMPGARLTSRPTWATMRSQKEEADLEGNPAAPQERTEIFNTQSSSRTPSRTGGSLRRDPELTGLSSETPNTDVPMDSVNRNTSRSSSIPITIPDPSIERSSSDPSATVSNTPNEAETRTARRQKFNLLCLISVFVFSSLCFCAGACFHYSVKHIKKLIISPFRAIYLVYYILLVELVLHWNNITGVNDLTPVGQLIPLIVSVGGILQGFKTLFLVWLNGDGREEREQDARQARISRDVSTPSSSEIVRSGGDEAREY